MMHSSHLDQVRSMPVVWRDYIIRQMLRFISDSWMIADLIKPLVRVKSFIHVVNSKS